MGTVDVDYVIFGKESVAIIVESDLTRQSVEKDLFLYVP